MAGCDLCPRGCGVVRDDGALGLCRCGSEAIIAHSQLHLWEEPPISGTRGSGTIFFAGCPLQCAYCQNAAISRTDLGRRSSPRQIAETMLGLQDQGAHNINLVTPTHFAPQIREAISQARKGGLDLPIIWNTSGYETVEAIKANRGFVDIYLTDLKYADAALGHALSGASDYPTVAIDALRAMIDAVGPLTMVGDGEDALLASGVVVRHLVLPGQVEDSKQVLLHLRGLGTSAMRLSLMSQYTPVIAHHAEEGDLRARRVLTRFPDLGRCVTPEEYEEVLAFADDLGFEDYFWQDGHAAEESFIPDFKL